MSLESLAQALKGPPPPNAKVMFKVSWGLYHEHRHAIIGSSPTPEIFKNYKFFTTKEKAEALEKDIKEAFTILGLLIHGYVNTTTEYYEE